MNVFNNLLSLYHKGSSVTPMEDFCTEALAGVLNSNYRILNDFAIRVLNLPENSDYILKTQQSYFNSDGKYSIVDMVIESDICICFLEMKVHAQEGHNQIQKYINQLKEIGIANSKDPQFRYCTLYYDPKIDFLNLDFFQQFRWADIAVFLENYIEENALVNEFYQFLKGKKMAGNERFTYEDIIGLKVYADITSKVNEVFNLVKEPLEKNFGKVKGVTSTSQITDHGRLAMYVPNVIGDTWSEVLISFTFRGMKPGNGPSITVQLYMNSNNSSFNKVSKAASIFMEDPKINAGRIRFVKPLAAFLEEENQLTEITTWIKEQLQVIIDFKNNNPDLGWNQ